jgi:hypothetical protein
MAKDSIGKSGRRFDLAGGLRGGRFQRAAVEMPQDGVSIAFSVSQSLAARALQAVGSLAFFARHTG